MGSISIGQICDAIAATLGSAASVGRTQSYDQIGEGIHDTPMLQVYIEMGNQAADSFTDRNTFGGGVRQTALVFHADYYARQRVNMGEDMSLLVDGIDELISILEAQDKKPYFDLLGIGAFSWSFQRVTFEYAGILYIGARFIINVRVF